MEKLFRSKTTAQRDAPQRVKDKKIHSPCPPCARGLWWGQTLMKIHRKNVNKKCS